MNPDSYFITVLPVTPLTVHLFGSQKSFMEIIYTPCLLHQPDFAIFLYRCFPKVSLRQTI